VGSGGPGAAHPAVREARQLADTIYRTVLNSGARLPPAHRATLLGAFSAEQFGAAWKRFRAAEPTVRAALHCPPAGGGSHTPHRVNTMMKLFH
jgi:hypothetical protein